MTVRIPSTWAVAETESWNSSRAACVGGTVVSSTPFTSSTVILAACGSAAVLWPLQTVKVLAPFRASVLAQPCDQCPAVRMLVKQLEQLAAPGQLLSPGEVEVLVERLAGISLHCLCSNGSVTIRTNDSTLVRRATAWLYSDHLAPGMAP